MQTNPRNEIELAASIPAELITERVISERVAATFCNLSIQYFRRLRYDGQGPAFVMLSPARVGYRLRDLMEWVEQRRRSPYVGTMKLPDGHLTTIRARRAAEAA